MKVAQIRLSSNDVMSETNYITVNLWRDRVQVVRFSYCGSFCDHPEEHDCAFDGQIFYKKTAMIGGKL